MRHATYTEFNKLDEAGQTRKRWGWRGGADRRKWWGDNGREDDLAEEGQRGCTRVFETRNLIRKIPDRSDFRLSDSVIRSVTARPCFKENGTNRCDLDIIANKTLRPLLTAADPAMWIEWLRLILASLLKKNHQLHALADVIHPLGLGIFEIRFIYLTADV